MQRCDPALCQCSFGLLCCASGTALMVSAFALLILS
jgi:hypothetical protein